MLVVVSASPSLSSPHPLLQLCVVVCLAVAGAAPHGPQDIPECRFTLHLVWHLMHLMAMVY